MSRRSIQTLLTLGATAVALTAVFYSLGSNAQEEASPEILVATYTPQQVAEAAGLQERVMQEMSGLQQRMQEAQQAGDQQAMQAIQVEARQIEQAATADFVADMEAVMPQVAERTGAQVIATNVSYTAPGVATEDVTPAVIEAMEGPAARAEGSR